LPQLEEVLREALVLDVQDRAALAEELLASLDEITEPEADRLWAIEAKRRLDEHDAGLTDSIPAHEVAEKAKKLLR
jgi:putative addiction module component (TIGR02574 family)